MNIFEELLSFKLTEALAKDKPKSTEKSESKAAENLEMEPKQSQQPTKSTEKVTKAIPMPWYTKVDDYHNNNKNTSPSPNPTKNEDKNKDRDGIKALKRGRQSSKEKSAPQFEEVLVSPPQKKAAIESIKGMEAENRAIFQSPPAMAMPSFYNNYPNYAGYGFMHPHPHAYYGYPSWSPMPSAPPSSPAPMMLSPSTFQHHKFGWFGFGQPPIPVATSTPLNPAFVCSTSSQQIDSSMMDVQKEAGEELSAEQSLTEGMWDKTSVGNTKMDLSNSWTINSMEDQSNGDDKNGPTSSGSRSTTGTQIPVHKTPIPPKQQFGSPYPPMFYPHPYQFGHPTQFPFLPYPTGTGHLPMPIYQQIPKDVKQENSEDAKDGIYRNCLVCGDQNIKCGKQTALTLQVCNTCREFFKKMVESGKDKTATFKCYYGPGNCLISKESGTRKSCKFCRFQACVKAGMDRQKIIDLKAKREKKNGFGNDDN